MLTVLIEFAQCWAILNDELNFAQRDLASEVEGARPCWKDASRSVADSEVGMGR
jgi:hypothetical protein